MTVKMASSGKGGGQPSFWDMLGQGAQQFGQDLGNPGKLGQDIGNGFGAASNLIGKGLQTGAIQHPFDPTGVGQHILNSFGNGAQQIGQFFGITPGAAAAPQGGTPQTQAPVDNSQQGGGVDPYTQGPSLTDFLNQALGAIGGQYGHLAGVYDQQANLMQNQAKASDQTLNEAYQQLAQRYAQDAPGIQQNFDTAAKTIAQNHDTAQQQTDAGYGAAAASQGDILHNLGIDQANANIIQRGNGAASQQAFQDANNVNAKADNLDLNALQRQIATNYNTQAGEAQNVAGGTQRALLQQNLAKNLQGLSLAKAQAQQEQLGQAISLADSMANSYWANQDRAYQHAINDRNYQLGIAKSQYSMGKQQRVMDAFNAYLKASGKTIDQLNPADVARVIQSFDRSTS